MVEIHIPNLTYLTVSKYEWHPANTPLHSNGKVMVNVLFVVRDDQRLDDATATPMVRIQISRDNHPLLSTESRILIGLEEAKHDR